VRGEDDVEAHTLPQYVVMRRKRVGPVSRDRVGAQDTRKEDES
jgi:hypothetical protein